MRPINCHTHHTTNYPLGAAGFSVAQMDMTKSTGFRAVEELLKAQSTHMTLKKQFEGARVTEMTLAHREVRKKSGGPEQKGILWTAVLSLLALISAVQIHAGLYTQGFPK